MKLLLFIISVSDMFYFTGAALFTGTDQLHGLSALENILLPDIKEILKTQQKKVENLNLVLHGMKQEQQRRKTKTDLSNTSNPVHEYLTIKRWSIMKDIFTKSEKNTEVYRKEEVIVIWDNDCMDESKKCKQYQTHGLCNTNKAYMRDKCRLSCGLCEPTEIKNALFMNVFAKFQNESRKQSLPKLSDFTGAAQGIVRLQRTYGLTTNDLIKGVIRGYISVRTFDKQDMINLGLAAYELGEWGLSTQWLRMGIYGNYTLDLDLLGNAISRMIKKTQQVKVVYTLAGAFVKLGDFPRANEVLKAALSPYINYDRSKKASFCFDRNFTCEYWVKNNYCNDVSYEKFMEVNCRYSCKFCVSNQPENFPGEHEIINLRMLVKIEILSIQRPINIPEINRKRQQIDNAATQYEQLCRGLRRTKRLLSNIGCRYRPALLQWNVYREEILSLNPRISMVYDVISDTEAELIVSKVKKKMKQAFVGEHREHDTITRVSNVGWLKDESDDLVSQFSHRVSLITGLEVQLRIPERRVTYISSDPFQAVNYGIGGHYKPHTDYFDDVDQINTDVGDVIRNSGDRLVTFLLYLTNVQAGGGTVFTKLNLHVPATKNAALFWYNAKLNGQYDPLTMHAGCPVLLGEKWVCNKWIREFGNHFKRRCHTIEDALYTSMNDIS